MYIPLGSYKQDDRVAVVDANDNLQEGRILRITPYKENYCLVTVLPDDKSDLVVAKYKNKINKLTTNS